MFYKVAINSYILYVGILFKILLIYRPENSGKLCSGGDQKYKSCSTEQVIYCFLLFFFLLN